ncbi:MAG: hypothetical protein KGR98_09400, partial [Verrucomicrobia bacterium]|nr:hypothetical protein [Verrucomicrobiota bacterium]
MLIVSRRIIRPALEAMKKRGEMTNGVLRSFVRERSWKNMPFAISPFRIEHRRSTARLSPQRS